MFWLGLMYERPVPASKGNRYNEQTGEDRILINDGRSRIKTNLRHSAVMDSELYPGLFCVGLKTVCGI